MVKILHLSDFHFNDANIRDWNNFIKDALIARLKVVKDINLIVCTGDLIDKGGKDFRSIEEAFNLFKVNVILPLIESCNLPIENFLIVPGNHDILRALDTQIEEIGTKGYLNSHSNISSFITNAIANNEFKYIERIKPFKKFEESLIKFNPLNDYFSAFGSAHRFNILNETVGVCCLNSAWRSYGEDDYENLILGEDQLVNCTKFIKDCTLKIGLMHHPIDWLSTIEREIIKGHIFKDFDILLLGHVHDNKTSLVSGFNGSIFINLSPSQLYDIRTDSKIYSNGFSVIEYHKDKESRAIKGEYYIYKHPSKSFVLNTLHAENGIFSSNFPSKKSGSHGDIFRKAIQNIKDDHYIEMDDYLLQHKAEINNKSIVESFIFPPIEAAQDNETLEGISQIVKSKFNQLFFGSHESGRTTLLYRLVREFADQYAYLNKIPVYVNFEDIRNKEILTVIKEYIRCSSEELYILLISRQLVLLIDNLNYKKSGNLFQYKKLDAFYNANATEIQIIATSDVEITGLIPTDHISLCKIPFKNFFIRSLKTKEIKDLMKLWVPQEDELQTEEKLEKMFKSFSTYSLPNTAMSVSLFLWCMENKERKPINHAVMIEIYIEILLEKLGTYNIYRDRFDFTNKIQMLAKIAEEMLFAGESNYSILYSDFERVVERYLETVGFDFDAQKLTEFFLNRRIFKKQGNRIKFSYSFYFHFFIAKRMEYNPEFREHILSENEYYKFNREIDYYTALVRSDEKVFNLILDRFKEKFSEVEIIWDQLNIDEYFSDKIAVEQKQKALENIKIEKIKEHRPTKETLEKYYNKRLQSVPDPSIIERKEGSISYDILLVLMSNVLRNSEGIEKRELKYSTYEIIVKYSLIFLILYKEWILNYVETNKRLPPSIPVEFTLNDVLENLPLIAQMSMNEHLGTNKLAPIILDKIELDLSNRYTSEIEKFMSIFLYSDVHGKDFPRYIKKFIKSINNSNTRSYTLNKLVNYLFRRSLVGTPTEELYLDLIGDLKLKSLKLPKRMKQQLIDSIGKSRKLIKE